MAPMVLVPYDEIITLPVLLSHRLPLTISQIKSNGSLCLINGPRQFLKQLVFELVVLVLLSMEYLRVDCVTILMLNIHA